MFTGDDIRVILANCDRLKDDIAVVNGFIYNTYATPYGSIETFNKLYNGEFGYNNFNQTSCSICYTHITNNYNHSELCQKCINRYTNMQDYHFQTINVNSMVFYKGEQVLIGTNEDYLSINFLKDEKLYFIKFLLHDCLSDMKCNEYFNNVKISLNSSICLTRSSYLAVLEKTWMRVRPHLINYNQLFPELNKYILQLLCLII